VQHRPRQIIGLSSPGFSRPIEISFTPGLDRKYLPVRSRLRLLVRAQHDRNVRAIHVGVEQPTEAPNRFSARARLTATGRFPDAALPAGDGDKIFLRPQWAIWRVEVFGGGGISILQKK